MNLENMLLMIPGPVPVAPAILRAMSKPMINHRSKEFSGIYTESRQILAELFRTENDVFVLSGSLMNLDCQKMIKIAINGAGGKIGRMLVENILRSNDMQLVAAIVANMDKVTHFDSGNIPVTNAKNADTILEKLKPDVLIDFTNASCAVEIIKSCARNGSNIVVGTTGFSNEQQIEIEKTIKKSNITAVISPNFSIGVNVFWSLIAETAKRFEDCDIEIMEIHHNQKKDAPGGTAINAAKTISETLGGKDFVYGRHGISPRQKEIGIHAIRGGDIIGDHVVLFAGDGERLEIKHQAHSRQAFAKGALLAARWIMNAPEGMYSMEDVLGI